MADKFDWAGASATFGNAIVLNFLVSESNIDTTKEYRVKLTKTSGETVVSESVEPLVDMEGYSAYYGVACYINPEEMSDVISAVILDEEGNEVSTAKEASVKSYGETVFERQTDAGKRVFVDLLNYGAEAQRVLSYNTENPANGGLTDEKKAYGTETVSYENFRASSDYYSGVQFNLENGKATLEFNFVGITEDMYAEIHFTNYRGEEIVSREHIETSADTAAIRPAMGCVKASSDVIADARQMIICTVYHADGSIYAEAAESVEGCIKLHENTTLGSIFVAYLKFADSAAAFYGGIVCEEGDHTIEKKQFYHASNTHVILSICTVCGRPVEVVNALCVDDDGDGICDVCGAVIDTGPGTFLRRHTWYKSVEPKSSVTAIYIVGVDKVFDSTCDGWTDAWDEVWDASEDGRITCYRSGSVIYIAGNGTGKLKLNADATRMFSKGTASETYFAELTELNGLEHLDASSMISACEMFASDSWAISYPTKIREFAVADWVVSNLRDAGWMFYGCQGPIRPDTSEYEQLYLDVSRWDVSKVEDFDHFVCHSYRTLAGNNVAGWKNEVATKYSSCFQTVQNEVLDVTGLDTKNTWDFANWFKNCQNLVEIKGLENKNTSNGKEFSQMFSQDIKLRKLDLSSFDTRGASAEKVDLGNGEAQLLGMSNMFYRNDSLQEVRFGEHFTLGNFAEKIVTINGRTGREETHDPNAILPTPSADHIDGADGKWYRIDGTAYDPLDVPDPIEPDTEGVAAIYFATAQLAEAENNTEMTIKKRTMYEIANKIRKRTQTAALLTPSSMAQAVDEAFAGNSESAENVAF